MKAYYLIDDQKYLDSFMLRERLGVSKDEIRGLLKSYNSAEVRSFQNKKLYPVIGLVEYAKQQIVKYEQEGTNA